MKKINVAELLKDCPKGMKLYSPIFGDVYLDKIRPHLAIVVTTDKEQDNFKEEFLYDGRYGMNGECMLFPSKGETTWEGFHGPFKNGDIIVDNENGPICIYKNEGILKGTVDYHCGVLSSGDFKVKNEKNPERHFGYIKNYRFASEGEKQRLFDAIKDNGYKWNTETMALEKLSKFKVGDKVQRKEDIREKRVIVNVLNNCYIVQGYGVILFTDQDEWELAPDKFDINTLVPFESKVLVSDYGRWMPAIYGGYNKSYAKPFFVIGGNCYSKCIPYEGNEHLSGTTNDCSDFYKI